MISISRAEADFLRDNQRGHDVHVVNRDHKSRGKRYYLTTSPKSMKLLNDYRDGKLSNKGA